jgi:hypothetical protein
MAAVAFTETAIFQGRDNGRLVHIRLTVDDVTAHYATGPDGSGSIYLPGDQDYNLKDIIIVTGGTDTSQQLVFCNTLNTGLVIDNKSNLSTVQFRQFLTSPVGFKAGSTIRLQELT